MRKKHGLKVLSVVFAAAMAFAAVAAVVVHAAANEGDFTANGTALTASQTFLATGLDGKLLVPAIGLNILCLNAHAEGEALGGTSTTNGVAHGVVIFKECSAVDNKGTKNATCVVDDIEAKGLALVVLVPGFTTEKFVLFEPETGKPFATIKMLNATGKECSFEPTYSVTGTLLTKATEDAKENSSAECSETGSGTELLLKEASKAQKEAGKDELLVGAHPSTVDGCVFAHYTGSLATALVGIKNL